EAGLAYAIAAAGLGNAQQAHSRLGVIRQKVGFQTLATKWGAAWALSLLDDWSCEGLLQQLHDRRPDTATFASLLALAQLHRHKLQSAIENAARGVALEPANRGAVLLLAHVLLLAGRTADAAARLDPLQDPGFRKREAVGSLVHEVLGRLNGLAEQRLGCTAWIATVPDGSLTLAGRSILVCAPSESSARACLETIVTAMQGSEPAAADL